MKMKADQERVKTLLTDTVTLLCKNGLQFSEELKVQGLLGITLDNNDVFVVHINEIFKGLVGAQVTGIHAEETSAIAAADSATSDLNLKTKKSYAQRYPSSSPVGSAKRKAWTRTSSPAVKVKKEVVEDDLVIIDSKCFDRGDFTTDDLSGDGDREAMRKSYGEIAETQQTVAPPKWRVPDSASESFVDSQSQLSGTYNACLLKNDTNKTVEGDDALGDSSLDESQLTGIGQLSGEGQLAYDSAPGCSGWESQVPGPSQVPAAESGSQDSIYTSPVVTSFMQQGLLKMPSAGPATKYDGSVEWMGNRKTSLPRTAAGTVALFQHDGSLGRKYRPKTAPNKPWACDFPGCNLRFYEKRTMTRHKRYKHAVGDRSFGGASNGVQHEAVGTNASGS